MRNMICAVAVRKTPALVLILASSEAAVGGQEGRDGPPRKITNSVGMTFIRIDPGSFQMDLGSRPSGSIGRVREVKLRKGFYLQTTEVTQTQWQAVMGTNRSHFKGPDLPVEMVSWNLVQEFLGKLNAREKGPPRGANIPAQTERPGYRLPAGVEWEYACRAGAQDPNDAPGSGTVWWAANSGSKTHPVAQSEPNAWGFYDMRGNVSEWVSDWSSSKWDPPVRVWGDGNRNDYRYVRGGSCASRTLLTPDSHFEWLGFRCARNL